MRPLLAARPRAAPACWACFRWGVLLLLLSPWHGDWLLAGEYRKRVAVAEPTRLDWTFAASTRSVADPPPEWVKHVYQSSAQTYEFYGPAKSGSRKPATKPPHHGYPLILFLSHKGNAIGWRHCEPICRQHGFLFAGPHGTFKGDLRSLRIRIVMDVLDDVRRHYPIDPDRTYIVGFYRNANIASDLAYWLPEYFGGLIAIAGGNSPPQDAWLQQQLALRLSVVHLVGMRDNRGLGNQVVGLVRRGFHPAISQTGTRSKLRIYPGRVHLMPPRSFLVQALRWLEADVARRRELTARFPSLSIRDAPSREEHAQRVLDDAQTMLADDDMHFTARLMLEGLRKRWPDVAAAALATMAIGDYDDRDGQWAIHQRSQQHKALQRRMATLRHRTRRDLPEGSVSYPRAYRDMTRWLDPVSPATGDAQEYDEQARQVIKRLGNRVQLDANGRVRLVDLSDTRVTGKQLRHFKQQLQGMNELQAIALSNAVMDESVLKHLADVTGLKALSLSRTELTSQGMEHLSQLDQLRFLSLVHTDVGSRGLRQLGSFREMRVLMLGGTRVNNEVADILSEAHQLRALSLASCRLDDEPSAGFTNLVSLEYLDLGSTEIGDATCRHLSELGALRELVLDYTRVTDQGVGELRRLPKLRRLSLLGTRVTDDGLAHVRQMGQLHDLNVRSTKVTDQGVAELQAARPRLQILWNGNRMVSIPQQLKEIENELSEAAPQP